MRESISRSAAVFRWLQEARRVLALIPQTPETSRESGALALLEQHLVDQSGDKFGKLAKYQAHQQQHGKPYP